ncbi:hypothetical protein [Gloeocapsopsis dulcis]|uniref:Uncharacterized protein n=1 Tax=Gloeocapsopsis dulcis AAB1 = 1H9 TaxID=1433147 RepID=A0A6N8FTT4_9CHRO|nr:hypothetical protein [Gloeocapsopsis dulcis]MUL36269.1 hypothetical protein [Gloeocapsopsis dulcis AAB1 = 1H9]WNN89620.1 hypothetical protein P0S91_00515 [Gloeocapsopsis dulcis]
MLATVDTQTQKMDQFQHFIHNLIELRDRYQTLQQKCDRAISHTTEQLNHINALLADQLVENQQFVENLVQLRAHYQTLHAQQQSKAQNAKEQIAHINALLADQIVLQHNELQTIVPSPTEKQNLNVFANSKGESQQQSDLLDNLEQSEEQNIEEASLPQPEPQTPTSVEELDSESELPIQSLDTEHSTFRDPHQTVASSRDFARPTHSPQQSRFLKTPLLPQYQHLSKSEAVEQLLQENEGSILHLDYIIRAVHGEIDVQDLKAEKLRMNDTLRKGVEKGLWEKVPDSPGCYTIDLKLTESDSSLNKDQNNQPRTQKHPNKSNEQLLTRYQNMSFTAAVATVVQENAGEILTPEKVARILYGEIAGKELTEAKAKVGKILWSGAKQGRWKSVPGQLGEYTSNTEAS